MQDTALERGKFIVSNVQIKKAERFGINELLNKTIKLSVQLITTERKNKREGKTKKWFLKRLWQG